MRVSSFIGGLGLVVLGSVAPVLADAASCGTVSAPTACSVELADGAVFTASEFALVNSTGLGGGNVYQASDIEIDVVAVSADTARLTFGKNDAGPTPGTVFFANAGETAGFIVSFTVAVDALAPGATATITGATNAITASAAGNGSSAVQIVFPGEPACQATTTSSSVECSIAGADLYETGIITTLSGNSGNTSILTIRETFAVTVPEPAAVWAMLASAAALATLRRSASQRVSARGASGSERTR